MTTTHPRGDEGGDGASLPAEINLLTLNCWGLLHISALRAPRLAEIGRQLARLAPAPHIVCLQECWTQEDYRAVRRETRRALPYGKFYHSGAFGGGLAILSRWPIEEGSMVRYPLNGRPTAFWRGDWYVGKGVACARIRFGPAKKDVVEVFNTHTHAPYEHGPDDSYLCHRTAQAWEISKLIRGATDRGHLVLAMGDFNMLPLSLAHRLISACGPIRDVWRVLHPDSSLGPSHHPAELQRQRPVPSAAFNLRENGATSDTVGNTWRWSKAQQKRLRAGHLTEDDPEAPDPNGKRLDYIFASTGNDPGVGPVWVVESASVAMTGRHPRFHVSHSDHFGVQATIRRHTPTGVSSASPATAHVSAVQSGAYLAPSSPTDSTHERDKRTDYDAQLRYFHEHDQTLPLGVYDEIIAMIHKYSTRERNQRYWRRINFFIAVGVWVGCLVAVWFSPANFVAFLLMLLSSLGLTVGVIEGLLSLIFFSSEIRALTEFEWEIRNAKAVASGDLIPLDEGDADDHKI